jgi:hypothetical protein
VAGSWSLELVGGRCHHPIDHRFSNRGFVHLTCAVDGTRSAGAYAGCA